MFALLALALALPGTEVPSSARPMSAREALQPFNVLVGSWKGTGYPEGVSRDERAAGFWTETITWG
jgi:hypothetical protein